jgi:hypothetical protein
MRLRDVDWSVLRGAAAFAAVSLVLGVAMIASGRWFHAERELAFQKEQRRFQANSRRYLAVDEEERLIHTHLPRYQELDAAGVVGDEHRLAWVEALREVSARLGLAGMRYEVMPRKPYVPPVPVSPGGLKVYASVMKVRLGLLHEDDLFRFIDAMTAQSLGYFNVERCTLRRTGEQPQADPATANLEAECDLQWLTVHRPAEESR